MFNRKKNFIAGDRQKSGNQNSKRESDFISLFESF